MATGWLIAGIVMILLACWMQNYTDTREDTVFGGKRFWKAVEVMGMFSVGIAALIAFENWLLGMF